MTSRYVPFTREQATALLEQEMGFTLLNEPNCWELVWGRDVVTKSGHAFPYLIKVYSTVDMRTGRTRECGADAIRLVLFDKVTGFPVKKAEKRVFRTKSAFDNIRARARELFAEVLKGPHCPKCGSLMVQREGGPRKRPFLGCSHYAPGRSHHCNGTREIEDQKAA